MKKFFSLLIGVCALLAATSVTHQARAQIVRTITIAPADDTLVNSDTAVVSLTFDQSFKSVEAWLDELSGKTAGKIVFQGELPHGGDWAGLDSLSLADQAAPQWKLFTVPNPRLHKAYRLVFQVDSTGTSMPKAYYIRYTGGAVLHGDPNLGLALLTNPNYIPPALMGLKPSSEYIRPARYLTNWKGELLLQPYDKPKTIRLPARSTV